MEPTIESALAHTAFTARRHLYLRCIFTHFGLTPHTRGYVEDSLSGSPKSTGEAEGDIPKSKFKTRKGEGDDVITSAHQPSFFHPKNNNNENI